MIMHVYVVYMCVCETFSTTLPFRCLAQLQRNGTALLPEVCVCVCVCEVMCV